jgi:hypothetical protein
MSTLSRFASLFAICLLSFLTTFAQNDTPSGFQKNRIFYGGNLGVGFGTITNVDISPTIGYFLSPKFALGIGITYQYYADKRFAPPLVLNIKGVRMFSRYYLLDQFFLHAEYEFLNFRTNIFNSYNNMETINLSSLLGGAGYSYPITSSSRAYLMVLYNFTETIYTPYANPVFRVGIDIGL